MDIKEKIKSLLSSPGIYLMKDKDGGVIYIGKAISIKKRVFSYFNKTKSSYKTDVLVSNIADVDFIQTSSEEEALLLEAALIREKKPKYNILLKDDKRYPLLKLTLNEKFPRLIIARRSKNDGAMYFGPYTSGKLLRKALDIMRRIFSLRTCKTIHKSPCLNYHIGQCCAPCINKINETGYKQIVDDIILFLNGRKKDLIENLAKRMKEASEKKDFETAAQLRNQIQALTALGSFSTKRKEGISILELQGILELPKTPSRIEAFDISDISGKEAVGSMASFFNGKPDKQNYRKFRIKYVFEADDYKMIEEVVMRRYRRLLAENQKFPDLILIDGGKGHVTTVKNALDKLNLGSIPVLGIAKKEERIFSPSKEIKFDKDSKALQLIMRIRDEAHRFAQSYHHVLRRKKIIGK